MNDDIDDRFNRIESRLSKLDILEVYIKRNDSSLIALLDSLESLSLSSLRVADAYMQFRLVNMKKGETNGQ